MKFSRLALLFLAALTFLSDSPSAHAWGCKGHETVALFAEAHLSPAARAMVSKILAAGPIDPALSRYCQEPNLDTFADASTWADDERTMKPDTAPWHFIDLPRGAPKSGLRKYCRPATGCVISALTAQVAVLRDPIASPQARADALRYIIHFVGDIHQPLHDTTNNDRGGNCVPVTFFGKTPRETNAAAESYSPNLHGVWDVNIIDQLSGSKTPEQLADDLNEKFQARESAWQSQKPNFETWAWESHQLAEEITYGALPVKIPIETARPVNTCADDHHISTRMLQLREDLEADYQNAAAPTVEEQLTKAGIRLAALLNSLWP